MMLHWHFGNSLYLDGALGLKLEICWKYDMKEREREKTQEV